MSYQGTLGYQGGKSFVADWIINRLPPSELFIDCFGGSGAVSLAAVRSDKFRQVIYNDLDKLIFTTLITIRDRFEELNNFLQQTPLGRASNQTIYLLKNSGDNLLIAAGCIMQLELTIFTPSLHNNEYNRVKVPNISSRNNVSGGYKTWRSKLDRLRLMQKDLLKIFLENRDWNVIVDLYAETSESALRSGAINKVIFLDPPYGDTQDYNENCSPEDVSLYFKIHTPYTIKILCDEEGREDLREFEYIRFPHNRCAGKKEYYHGIYLNDNDNRVRGFI